MKKILIVLSLLLCLATLCGCASFNAADLLQGNLDLIYLNKHTDAYLESVDLTAEEAEQQYAAAIEAELEYFADYFDADLTLCSGELKDELREFYRSVYSHSKYEVGEAAKTDSGYEVALTVYPIDILQKFRAEDAAAFMADWEKRYNKGEFDAMTDTEYEETWVFAILGALNPRLAEIGHLEGETITVQIIKDEESGLCAIPEEDFSAIDALILAY